MANTCDVSILGTPPTRLPCCHRGRLLGLSRHECFHLPGVTLFRSREEERCRRSASHCPNPAYMRACCCLLIHGAEGPVARWPCRASWSQRAAASSLSGWHVRRTSAQQEHSPSHGNILPDTSRARPQT